MKEALLYEKLSDNSVHCFLCAHHCRIADGDRGFCRVRENRGGKLFTLVYGRIIAQNVDPIEKKPLYHFYPGSKSFSVATPGCNFRCQWCQNCEIAQMPVDAHFDMGIAAEPDDIVEAARARGCVSIAYTYTEPTIFFEYSLDIAEKATAAGIKNVYVTNGYMTEEMLDRIYPNLHAANVDLKGFNDEAYRKYTGARLKPVLQSLKKMKELGIWIEVTTLVVPGVNDDPAELRELTQFIADELGPEVPWHISRFHPAYKMMKTPSTPIETLHQAQQIGEEAGLQYIYIGNVAEETFTKCPECGAGVMERSGYFRPRNRLVGDGNCPECNAVIAGVGMGPETLQA